MKRKMKVTADSVVLGVSGEAMLVLGMIFAFKPEWNNVMAWLLFGFGLFTTVWGLALIAKRHANHEDTLTAVLTTCSLIGVSIGLLGAFTNWNEIVLGLIPAACGIAMDIVIAIIGKKQKKEAARQALEQETAQIETDEIIG